MKNQITNPYYEEIKEMAFTAIEQTTAKSFLNQSCHIRTIKKEYVTLEVDGLFLLNLDKKMQKAIEDGFSKAFDCQMFVLFVQR